MNKDTENYLIAWASFVTGVAIYYIIATLIEPIYNGLMNAYLLMVSMTAMFFCFYNFSRLDDNDKKLAELGKKIREENEESE